MSSHAEGGVEQCGVIEKLRHAGVIDLSPTCDYSVDNRSCTDLLSK